MLEVLEQHLEAGLAIRCNLARLEMEALSAFHCTQIGAQGAEGDRPCRLKPLHNLINAIDQLVRIPLLLLQKSIGFEGGRQLRVLLHFLDACLKALAEFGFDGIAPLLETVRLIQKEERIRIEVVEKADLLLLRLRSLRTV